jgi:hypothetical protein
VAFILSVFFVSFLFWIWRTILPYTPLSTIIAALECKTTLKAWDGCDRYQRRAIFCEYNNTIPFVYCL